MARELKEIPYHLECTVSLYVLYLHRSVRTETTNFIHLTQIMYDGQSLEPIGRSNVSFQRTYTALKGHLPSVCGLLAGIPRTPHPSELSPYYPLSPGAVGSIAHPLGWFMPQ